MPLFNGYKVLQDFTEFDQFCQVLRDAKARSYLEIGCWSGGTLQFVAAKALAPGSRIVAIDKPWKPTKEGVLRQAMNDLRNRGFETHLFIGDSTDQKIIDAAKKLGPYDAVFIDGDHRYEYVKRDWENYGLMGRVVGFHDIARNMPEDQHGGPHEVCRFWNDLKGNCPKIAEFISATTKARTDNAAYGIGVVWR